MHDDDPSDVVHDLFAAGALRRHARSAGRSSARVESITAISRDARSPATTGAATGRRTWSSRPPATSTTPRSCGWCARRSPPPGCSAATPVPSPPRGGDRRPASRRRRPRGAARPTEQANLVLGVPGAAPQRRAPLRARRAQQRARRRHVARGCSRRSARSAAWPTRSTRYARAVRRHRPVRRLRRLRSRARSTRCSRICRERAGQGRRARASPTRSSPAARASCAGSLVLGLEDTGSRMSRLGKGELRLRRAALRRRGARPHRRGDARRRRAMAARAARGARRRSPSIGPFDDDRDFSAAVA